MAVGRILFVVIAVAACTRPGQGLAQDNPWRVPGYGDGDYRPERPAYERNDRGSPAFGRAARDGNRPRRDKYGNPANREMRRANRPRTDRYGRYGYDTNGFGSSDRGAAPANRVQGRSASVPRSNPPIGYAYGQAGPGVQDRSRQRQAARHRPPPKARSYGGNVRGRFVPSIGNDGFDQVPPRYRARGYGDYPPLDPGPTGADRQDRRPVPAPPTYARRPIYIQPSWPPYAAQPANPGWGAARPVNPGWGAARPGAAPRGFTGPSTFGNAYGGTYGGMPGGHGYPGGLGYPGGFGLPFF